MKDVKLTIENEEILRQNVIDMEAKYNELKSKYDLINNEKKDFLGQMNILRSQKNNYFKENKKNKELLDNYISNNEVLNKERDEYKKQRDKFYAHQDKKINIDTFFSDYPVSIKDFEMLIILNVNIFNSLNAYFNNKTLYPVAVNCDDFKKTIYYIKKGVQKLRDEEG